MAMDEALYSKCRYRKEGLIQ